MSEKLPDTVVKFLLAVSKALSRWTYILQKRAIKFCKHTNHEESGGHQYCVICDKHVGDLCRGCGHMKKSFIETCKACGKWD